MAWQQWTRGCVVGAGVTEHHAAKRHPAADRGAVDLEVGVWVADRELTALAGAVAGGIGCGDAERIAAITVRGKAAAGWSGACVELPLARSPHGQTTPTGSTQADLQGGSHLTGAAEAREVLGGAPRAGEGDLRGRGVYPQLSGGAIAGGGAVGILHRCNNVVGAIREGVGRGQRQAPGGAAELKFRRGAQGVGAAVDADPQAVDCCDDCRAAQQRCGVVGEQRIDCRCGDWGVIVVNDGDNSRGLDTDDSTTSRIDEGKIDGFILLLRRVIHHWNHHGLAQLSSQEIHIDAVRAVIRGIDSRAIAEADLHTHRPLAAEAAVEGDGRDRRAVFVEFKAGSSKLNHSRPGDGDGVGRRIEIHSAVGGAAVISHLEAECCGAAARCDWSDIAEAADACAADLLADGNRGSGQLQLAENGQAVDDNAAEEICTG